MQSEVTIQIDYKARVDMRAKAGIGFCHGKATNVLLMERSMDDAVRKGILQRLETSPKTWQVV